MLLKIRLRMLNPRSPVSRFNTLENVLSALDETSNEEWTYKRKLTQQCMSLHVKNKVPEIIRLKPFLNNRICEYANYNEVRQSHTNLENLDRKTTWTISER